MWCIHGRLDRYVKLRIAHAPGMPRTFSPPQLVSNPDMHYGTCVTHVLWCMPGTLTSDFLWSQWREKRSRHSRRVQYLHFYVCGKRPIKRQGNLKVCISILSVDSTTPPAMVSADTMMPDRVPYIRDWQLKVKDKVTGVSLSVWTGDVTINDYILDGNPHNNIIVAPRYVFVCTLHCRGSCSIVLDYNPKHG